VKKPKKIKVKLSVMQADMVLAALYEYHRNGFNAEHTADLRAKLEAWVDEQVIGPKATQRRVIRKPTTPIRGTS
jgi:hypothetical protein